MTKEQFFSVAIRIVFLFAFGAFLFASIHHIATFFDNFEQGNNNWFGSYSLAISIDATALVLTIGVMFFRHNMPWYALVFVWFFIISLTAFSWLVNWEYAQTFQSNMLATNDTLKMINPILASSFAFLNLAYSLVSEFFSARVQTAEDMEIEAKRLEGLIDVQIRIDKAREQLKKPSLIQRAKELAIEVKNAATEVVKDSDQEALEADVTLPNEDDIERDTDPEMEIVTPPNEDDIISHNDSDIVDDMPDNIVDISDAKKPHYEKDMLSNLENNIAANKADISAKRGPYAITKEAASELLRCPLSEIERGIMEGIIKPFAKSNDKVLRASLDGFTPQKRIRKTAKVATNK